MYAPGAPGGNAPGAACCTVFFMNRGCGARRAEAPAGWQVTGVQPGGTERSFEHVASATMSPLATVARLNLAKQLLVAWVSFVRRLTG